MASILKVDTIQDQAGNNIISESANVITIGASGDTITIPSGASMSGFNSTGIDDNATSTAITIDSNENVGIGTSSPGTKLDILATGYNASAISTTVSDYAIKLAGATTSSYFSNGLIFSEGTLARSAIGSFDGGSSGRQGLWFATHNGTSMAERVRIDSSGNVGIGTSSPSTNLEIADASTPKIRFSRTGAYYWDIGHTNSDFQFESQTGGVIMHMNFDGNVGIGTTSPSTNLDISSSGDATINLKASGQSNGLQLSQLTADGGSSISATNNNYLKFSTNATERMRIDSSGNVGIGTTSPDSRLEVLDSSATGIISRSTSTQATDTNKAIRVRNNSDTNTFSVSYKGLGYFAGNVGIGTTSPNAELEVKADTPEIRIDSTSSSGRNYKIHSDGDELYLEGIGSSGSLKIGEDGTYNVSIDLGTGEILVGTTSFSSGSRGKQFEINTNAIALRSGSALTSTQFHNEFHNPNGSVGSISTSGSGTNFNTSSDYRLKENVNYDFDATTRLKQLKPARFNFITDADTTVDGFLAHEVSSVVPEAISGEKDAVKEDGTPEYQGIDQSKLVPVLTKALQEAITKIEELETRIQTLENN